MAMTIPPEAANLPDGWTLTPVPVGPDTPFSAHGKHEEFSHATWYIMGPCRQTRCVGTMVQYLIPQVLRLPGESWEAECLGMLVWFGLPAVHWTFQTTKPAYGVVRAGTETQLYREVVGEVPALRPPVQDATFPKGEPPRTIYRYEFRGRKTLDWIADEPLIAQWTRMVENDPSFTPDLGSLISCAIEPPQKEPPRLPEFKPVNLLSGIDHVRCLAIAEAIDAAYKTAGAKAADAAAGAAGAAGVDVSSADGADTKGTNKP
ncbi:hypothetical protein BO86DRAFT_401834 [Aspergillus japonicus CBS 114.51]|uniref:Uncharacterized protein n=1 Tax=Aspergillus japonicus CBS 114.51 TaxID=1448312 RepID=A0A8T8WUJ1_ASPJA|nr:hypothetical protein BO86DRAFT_401834 [Aspergillus japonicus CBS 114.51]RAH79481.1 hypothetical protein BO86DRAFT_401834 [Aspergillus japonicus CBS 114.51]